MTKPKTNLQHDTVDALVVRIMNWPQRRQEAGIRLLDVAERLGISLKQYHLWEYEILMKGLMERVEKIERVEDAIAELEQEAKANARNKN